VEQMDVLSPWVADPLDGSNIFGIQLDYPGYHSVVDITGTRVDSIPSEPNSLVCRVAGPTATLDAIEGDPNYALMEGTRGIYDPSNQTPAAFSNDIPKQNEFVQFRNSVTSMQHGGKPVWNTGQLNQAIGPTVAGRTWGQINQEMKMFLAAL